MALRAGQHVPPGRPVIERASSSDRAFLAMDTGDVPEQFGVILIIDDEGRLDLSLVRQLIGERVQAIPRLRQRLERVPFGCGGPVWVDDPQFDIRHHVRAVTCPKSGDERALLDMALGVLMTPLPRAAPLWSAVLVTGVADGNTGLVLVLHHALADGIGGLAVLSSLTDAAVNPPPRVCFPRSAPTRASLAREAATSKFRALRHTRQYWQLLRASMSAGGGLRPPRVASCSLNQPTGPRRTLLSDRVNLAAVRAAVHGRGATVNDAILVAVSRALYRVIEARGESVDALTVTVPVSGRQTADGPALGNMVSPMLVCVPATGAPPDGLRQVTAQVRAHKREAAGPPPIALLGWLFRPLAALGGYRWYMNHQHRFHTLVSHVRGSAELVSFGGYPVTAAIPMSVGPGGNIPIYFEVLSYAGALTVTAIADPDHFTELETLASALHDELSQITELQEEALWSV